MKRFKMFYINVQLGQASVNPLDLCLNWGGDFNFSGSHAWEAEVPLLGTLKWDFSFPVLAAC